MALHRAFWVIVQGSTPTAFRARRAEDLLPTLHQLQRTQPDTYLRWFDRGRFWESPEAEREAFLAARRASSSRNREWRPGGDHVDPRARFKVPRDEKRARFKARQRRPWDRGEGSGPAGERPPRGPRPEWSGERRSPSAKRQEPSADRREPRAERREPGGKRPWKSKPRGSRPPGGSGSSRPPGRHHNRGPRRPKGPRGPKGGS